MSYRADIERSVMQYDPGEKHALREFQRAHFGAASRQCDDEFSHWLFERNPNRSGDRAPLWLCKRDGIVVGQQGSIPVTLRVGEVERRASWVIDLMVHRDWRLKGVAPALFASYRQSTDIMLGLGVEDTAYKTFRRAGWQEIGRASLFVRPLDPQACTQALNAPKRLMQLAPRALVGGSAHVAGLAMRALTRVSLDPVSSFDERVDDLWTLAKCDYPIIVRRDFASLRWRFDEVPGSDRYKRYYLTRKGRLLGYAVVRWSRWHGHAAARVVDYFAQRRWLAPLLALVFDELNAKRAVAVFVEQVHIASENVLRSLGCLRARDSWRFMFHLRDAADPVAASLSQVGRWMVTTADSDFDPILIAAEQSASSPQAI